MTKKPTTDKIDKKVNALVKTFQKTVFDEELVATAVVKLQKGERKKALLVSMAKWKAFADFSTQDLEAYLAISDYDYSYLCGLCHLYSDGGPLGSCNMCPIVPKESNDSGCCIEFDRFSHDPTPRRALAIYNRIKKAYEKLYGGKE